MNWHLNYTTIESWLHFHFTNNRRCNDSLSLASTRPSCPYKTGILPMLKGIEEVTDANYNSYSAKFIR